MIALAGNVAVFKDIALWVYLRLSVRSEGREYKLPRERGV